MRYYSCVSRHAASSPLSNLTESINYVFWLICSSFAEVPVKLGNIIRTVPVYTYLLGDEEA